jgi:hypothetical protein
MILAAGRRSHYLAARRSYDQMIFAARSQMIVVVVWSYRQSYVQIVVFPELMLVPVFFSADNL